MEIELPVDPRFGGPRPDPLPRSQVLAPATRHAFVGALVDDPVAWAATFATLLGTTVTFEDAEAAPGRPVAGVSLGDCTLALYPLPGDGGRALWGRQSYLNDPRRAGFSRPRLPGDTSRSEDRLPAGVPDTSA